MADGRGLPLLSGPPPSPSSSSRAEIFCRKCSKEFNLIFTRSRKCNHCGYSYCHNCSDFQALMPRGGAETGYDVMNVCAYCIEYLTITAGGRGHLKSLPLAKLKKYVNVYNISIDRAVEKDDLIDGIIAARGQNGCLSQANEEYYRRYSVPDKPGAARPRGIFSRSGRDSDPPPIPQQRPPNSQPTYNFPRPDLEPDDAPRQQYAPPPQPPPQSYSAPPPPPPRPHMYSSPPPPQQSQSYHSPPHPPPRSPSAYNSPPQAPPRPQPNNTSPPQPPPRSHPNYAGPTPRPQSRPQQPATSNYTSPPPQPPPRPEQPSPSQRPGPYQRPAASHSSHNLNVPNSNNPTPPRPRAASVAPPPTAPPPTLDELLEMTTQSIASLSIGALKGILFTNHVNAGMILEKGELVKKVKDLVEEERRGRERQRILEEQEEHERVETQRAMIEEYQEARLERENAEGNRGAGVSSSTGPPPLPPKAQAMASNLERTGLCVICQDDEANIAIVDCGHLAMCRECSDMVMTGSRECPLCRTRIVTEARLLRIFKT